MAPNGHTLRILVVEDHDDTRALMEAFLSSLGHEVTLATTVHEGGNALARTAFDVLLSDIGLPDGRGWDLPSKARPDHPLYAIAMSGFGSPPDHQKSGVAGFRHHLLKPLDLDQLENILEEAKAEHFARAEAAARP